MVLLPRELLGCFEPLLSLLANLLRWILWLLQFHLSSWKDSEKQQLEEEEEAATLSLSRRVVESQSWEHSMMH